MQLQRKTIEREITLIIEKEKLTTYYKIVRQSFEGRKLGFHNMIHTDFVLWLCYQAAVFYQLSEKKRRVLLIAALFHDSNYQGRDMESNRVPDIVNVEIACHTFLHNVLPGDRELISKVIDHIRATEFPYKKPTSSLSLTKQILRESDLSQFLCNDWLTQTIGGLAEEWNMNPIDLLKGQEEFAESNLNYITLWGQSFLAPLVVKRLLDVKKILSRIKKSKQKRTLDRPII